MGILKKEEIMYANENGKLIAKETTLYGTDDTTIKVIPMIPEDIQKMMELGQKLQNAMKKDDKEKIDALKKEMEGFDAGILDKHLIEPKISAEELKLTKPLIKDRIMKTIMLESGIPEKNLTFGYNKEGDSLATQA